MFAKSDFERLESLKGRGFSPKVVFDVGASNGGWSRVIAPLFPEAEFHLFEPLIESVSEYAEQMQRFLSVNPQWHLHKVALGEGVGSLTFNRQLKSPFGSTSIEVENAADYQQISVPLETIDHLVANGLPGPQFIKLDIQAGELTALKGAEKTLPQVELLLIETWFSRGYGKNTPLIYEVMNWLSTRNFVPIDYSDEYRNSAGQLIALDIFFANQSSSLVQGLNL